MYVCVYMHALCKDERKIASNFISLRKPPLRVQSVSLCTFAHACSQLFMSVSLSLCHSVPLIYMCDNTILYYINNSTSTCVVYIYCVYDFHDVLYSDIFT
jgi:hypothetical protein